MQGLDADSDDFMAVRKVRSLMQVQKNKRKNLGKRQIRQLRD